MRTTLLVIVGVLAAVMIGILAFQRFLFGPSNLRSLKAALGSLMEFGLDGGTFAFTDVSSGHFVQYRKYGVRDTAGFMLDYPITDKHRPTLAIVEGILKEHGVSYEMVSNHNGSGLDFIVADYAADVEKAYLTGRRILIEALGSSRWSKFNYGHAGHNFMKYITR